MKQKLQYLAFLVTIATLFLGNLLHTKAALAQHHTPTVLIDFSNNTLTPNSWVSADVMLKVSDPQLVEQAASVSFKILLPTQIIDFESISIDESKNWDATPTLIAQNTDNNSEGKNVTFNIDFVRKGNISILPLIKLATVNFFITDNIDGKGLELLPPNFNYPLNIRLYDAYGYSNKGAFLGIDTQNPQTSIVFTDYVMVTNSQEFSIKTYPNPTSEFLYINVMNAAIHQIEVYDMQGKKMNIYEYESDKSNIRFDISSLQTGNYAFVFKTNNGQITKKIISVQR